jgi:hypothetical protein
MIYLAAPLFTAGEKQFNRWLARELQERTHEHVILPQETEQTEPLEIARECKASAERCDKCVAILDGADADSGVALEVRLLPASHQDHGTLHVPLYRSRCKGCFFFSPSRWDLLQVGLRVALGLHVLGVRTDFRKGSSDDVCRGVNAMFRLVAHFCSNALDSNADVDELVRALSDINASPRGLQTG